MRVHDGKVAIMGRKVGSDLWADRAYFLRRAGDVPPYLGNFPVMHPSSPMGGRSGETIRPLPTSQIRGGLHESAVPGVQAESGAKRGL